ncbi:sensor histidine kinase [Thiovibrio sp. JS02]
MQAEQWEDAYLAQSQDAAIGRMFRGIIHNLNGMVQVFSLQTELFEMMVAKALDMLAQMQESQPSPETAALLELISRRSSSLAQMKEKVLQSQKLLHRTLILPDFSRLAGISPYTINTVLEAEVEFLCADNFFKHKVEKKLLLAEDPPALAAHHLELHQILHLILQNALDAVREVDDARVVVESRLTGDGVAASIEDNGPGIDPAALSRIYEPFYTTRQDHLGVGLYLAAKLAGRCGGAISCESRPGRTRFQLLFPVQA